MLGARWVQKEILAKDSTIDLRVYAIWFNMYPGDRRSRWNPKRISDPRVMHYWDEKKIVGRWLVDQQIVDYPDEVLWDAYLLFGPEASWNETPRILNTWGRPVYPDRKRLAASLIELLGLI